MATQAQPFSRTQGDVKLWKVILASSLGTLIEWYDFYLYGVLSVFFATLFYPQENPTAGLLASLATFGAGFAVRPFGAVVFGRVGDLIGRKYAFLVTLSIMGFSTFAVGLLPTYATIGIAAPIILVLLRLLQGLALGGEYGGAATYVAEHAPDSRRGYYTSFIQTTATMGLLTALVVILITRKSLSDADFKSWGWRIPFLLSAILVLFSLYIRLKMRESPLFARLKESGKSSKAPLRESLGSGRNWRLILLALFGATAGQAVVWYTGQFYVLTFLQTTMKLRYDDAYIIVAAALLLATPFFVVFGGLSDRLGRKKIMLGGCLIAALTYVPIYMAMNSFAGPLTQTGTTTSAAGVVTPVMTALSPNTLMLILLVFIQVLYVTMVYGPIAAFLVELFPARIRYTSMSLPYHIGNGEFGGWLPFISTAIVASQWAKDAFGANAIYAGLIYPIVVALSTVIIGGLFLRETKDVRIWDEVETA